MKKSMLFILIFSGFVCANENFVSIVKIDNFAKKTGIIEKYISEWVNSGSVYNCTTWTPDVYTIDYGESFTQNRECSQDQIRTKDIYIVYDNDFEVYEKTVTETQTISERETQTATGLKNFIVSTSTEHSAWSNSGSLYDCSSWTPDASTIDQGNQFTQERICSQDQIQNINIYDVWADDSKTLNRVETGNNTISITESQSSVGVKVIGGVWNRSGFKYLDHTQQPFPQRIDYSGKLCSNIGSETYSLRAVYGCPYDLNYPCAEVWIYKCQ